MKKNIYIYWGQKFVNSPTVVSKCLLSWKLNNSTWNIIELNDENLNEYINIEKEIPDINKKNITKTSYSDIVRIFLLAKYGGFWCDATTFCNQSLDNWLNENILTSFFAFDKPGKNRLISTWFLYGDKNSYIIKKWKEKTINYWKNNDKMHNYFWFHYLFNDLYNSDNKFKELWDSTPKISANGPHYLEILGLLNKTSNKVKNHIKEVKTPFYKLSYKYDIEKFDENCNLSYIMNTINLKFIHVPKTGGTSIENAAKNNNLLWGRFDKTLKSFKNISPWHSPQEINSKCFCVIRDPFDRFISQFYHENKVDNYNSEKLNNFIKIKIPQINKNININDNHYLPQYKFCEKCDYIISFDNLQNNVNNLMKIFNLDPLILNKLPGGIVQQKKRNKININRLTYLDINKENRNLLKQMYKIDFELYNKVKKLDIFKNTNKSKKI